MATVDEILQEFPGPAQEALREVWRNIPADQRNQLARQASRLPASLKPLRQVLDLVADQYRPLVAARQRIAIVGPANVGKSTLYNQLISRRQDRAAVGAVPGTTRRNQEADTGLFRVVDTPGADAVGEVGERERAMAFQAAAAADLLVVMFDATHGIKRAERDLFDSLQALGKPYIVLLNKIDLVPREERPQVVEAAARNLRLDRAQVIETVATDGTNVGRVILAIAKAEPGLLAAIAEALPQYRARLAWGRIVPAGAAAATVALVPLPLADVFPLLAIQTGLVLSISRIYGFQITAARAREIIATFGVGLAARTAFAEISKLGGLPGWLLASVIATSTTVAIGYGALTWFSRGERPSQDALKKLMIDTTSYLRKQLGGLAGRRPDARTMRERVARALQGLPRQLPSGNMRANRGH